MSLTTVPGPEVRRLERGTRTMPPTNISAEFILNSIVLAENSQYVPEHDRFVSLTEAKRHDDDMLELWKDASAEKGKLIKAIELLRQKSRPKDTPKSETEGSLVTWKQVIAEVQVASDAYSKTIFAKMREKAEIFEHWLTLLPCGDYSSTISGAFLMGVQAARGLHAIQKNIYEALASIPDTLSHASAYVEIYKAHSSHALVQKTAYLCKSILTTLRLIIEFFLKGTFRRGAAAILKGSAHQQELTESILEMKTQALNLREEANVCLQKRIAEMDQKSDLRASKEQFRHELAKEELLLAIDSSTEITAQKVCTYLLRQLQANPEFCVRTGGPLPSFKSTFSIADNEADLSTTSSEIYSKGVTSDVLLQAVEFDSGMQKDDVAYCLTLGFTQSEAFQARAAWVLRSPELGKFLAGKARAKILVINGNSDPTHFISPLSYVCAKIADLVGISQEVVLLTHFCSHHTDELRESRANATGLVGNLLGQLLTQLKSRKHINFRLDLTFVDDSILDAIQGGDMGATFNLLRAFILQLPKGTVIFCLIDGISAYENTDRKDSTIALMKKLSRLVKKAKGIAFKCMVTYPGRSNYLDAWDIDFHGKDAGILDVPEEIYP